MPNSLKGLELARLADLPPEVLTEARRVAERLSEMEAERREASRSTKLKTQLIQALEHSKLPDEALASYLLTLQKEIVNVLADTAEEPDDT
ncbi:MutS protein msh4 [Tulasnella sp. 408]|nr:MutS protein msh4 [Tulasnella sp. 408]